MGLATSRTIIALFMVILSCSVLGQENEENSEHENPCGKHGTKECNPQAEPKKGGVVFSQGTVTNTQLASEPAKSSKNNSGDQQESQKSEYRGFWTDLKAQWTMAVMAVLLTVITFGSLKALTVDRAWITVDDSSQKRVKIGGMEQAQVFWKNTGNTPALDVERAMRIIPILAAEVDPEVSPDFLENAAKWTRFGAIGSNQQIFSLIPFSPEFLKFLNDPSYRIFIVTKIKYRTIHGDEGFTQTTVEAIRLGGDGEENNFGVNMFGDQICV